MANSPHVSFHHFYGAIEMKMFQTNDIYDYKVNILAGAKPTTQIFTLDYKRKESEKRKPKERVNVLQCFHFIFHLSRTSNFTVHSATVNNRIIFQNGIQKKICTLRYCTHYIKLWKWKVNKSQSSYFLQDKAANSWDVPTASFILAEHVQKATNVSKNNCPQTRDALEQQ